MTTIQLSTMRFEEDRPYRKEARTARADLDAAAVDDGPVRQIVSDSICADHGCDLAHPGTTHDAYDARFDHARACQVCRQVFQQVIAPEVEGGPRPPGFLGLRCGFFVTSERTG
jgi:hypothetical protein